MNEEKKIEEISTWYDKNYKIYRDCAKEMSEIIKKILDKKKISYHSISFRVKEKSSYIEKCKKEKYKDPIQEVMDLAGIRIITYTNMDVHAVCEVVKKELYIDEENSEDKSQKMGEDQVGYLSVHYIAALREERTQLAEYEEYAGIRSEIQIRTLLQHAWAEIEHDRNYKFSGVLPPEIRRRFYLIAGVLEMMDKEFDSLSEDIDKYTQETKYRMEKGDFKVSINSKSLEKYVMLKFKNTCITCGLQREIINDEIIKELNRFGFQTIRDIEEILTEDMLHKLEVDRKKNTYIGVLRDMMMIVNIDKYFNEAYGNSWGGIDCETLEQFKKLGINLRKYISKYKIVVS